jgi:hypothetical protein
VKILKNLRHLRSIKISKPPTDKNNSTMIHQVVLLAKTLAPWLPDD